MVKRMNSLDPRSHVFDEMEGSTKRAEVLDGSFPGSSESVDIDCLIQDKRERMDIQFAPRDDRLNETYERR